MAKRRKEKDEEEEKPFKLPKFDEEKFLKRERRNIKTTFLSFIFGIAVAVISFGFWVLLSGNSVRWYLVFLFGVITGSWLKYLFIRLNIDITDFTKKNWFASFMIYFFTWLVVLMVIVNPPFYDEEEPLVNLVILPEMQEPGGTVEILAKITDNTGVEKQDITFTLDGKITPSKDFDFTNDVFRYTYGPPTDFSGDETHNFKMTVKDSSGHTTVREGSFTFSNDTIYLAKPQSGSNVVAADDIKFAVRTDVWRVYYTANDGKKINATQQSDRKEYYVTTPEFQGWPPGEENVTVKVSAMVICNFQNHFLKDYEGNLILDNKDRKIPYWFVNYINDTSTYSFNVGNESMIGKTESEVISRPEADVAEAPGFEILAFLISLGVVVLIFKYRKKDRRN